MPDPKPLTAEELLREVVEFVADWAHDCSPSNAAAPWERQHTDEIDPRNYGFDDIEDRCRAALDATPAPTGGLDAAAFRVRGLPAAQGSGRAIPLGNGRAVLATDNRKPGTKLGAWRVDVRAAATEAMGAALPATGPVAAVFSWWFRRPASHYLPANSKRPERVLRPDAPTYTTSRADGDIDKLERSVLDALTGIVYVDDDQVVSVRKVKLYEVAGEPPGVAVWVTELEA